MVISGHTSNVSLQSVPAPANVPFLRTHSKQSQSIQREALRQQAPLNWLKVVQLAAPVVPDVPLVPKPVVPIPVVTTPLVVPDVPDVPVVGGMQGFGEQPVPSP